MPYRMVNYKDSSSNVKKGGNTFVRWKRGITKPDNTTNLRWEVAFNTIELIEDLPTNVVKSYFPYEKRKLAKECYDSYYTRLLKQGKTIVSAHICLVTV